MKAKFEALKGECESKNERYYQLKKRSGDDLA